MARNSWKRISEQLGAPAADCESAWMRLRKRFMIEKRLVKEKGKTDWLPYESLSFLSDHIRARRRLPREPRSQSTPARTGNAETSSNSEGLPANGTDALKGQIDVLALIELVKSYPHLYDLKNENIKNETMKAEAWKEISTTLNVPVDECQGAWKTLRKRLLYERKLGVGKSEWPYLEPLSFLSHNIRKRRRYTPAAPKNPQTAPKKFTSSNNAGHSKVKQEVEYAGNIADSLKGQLDVLAFIELVKKIPLLYDSKHIHYRNEEKRNEPWKRISETLDLSVEDCKKTWTYLRKRYAREKKLVKGKRESEWLYYEPMSFLARHIRTRKSKTAKASNESTSSNSGNNVEAPLSSSEDHPTATDFVKVELSHEDDDNETDFEDIFGDLDNEDMAFSETEQNDAYEDIDNVAEDAIIGKWEEKMDTEPIEKKPSLNELFGVYVASRLDAVDHTVAERMRSKITEIIEQDH